MTDVDEDRAPLFLAFSVIFLVLPSFTVGLRLLSRRISAANLWWEYVRSRSHTSSSRPLEPCLGSLYSPIHISRLGIALEIVNTDGNPAMHSFSSAWWVI